MNITPQAADMLLQVCAGCGCGRASGRRAGESPQGLLLNTLALHKSLVHRKSVTAS